MEKKKYKVGDIVKFNSKAHNSEISNAIVKITNVVGSHFFYDIIRAPNTTRKRWNTYGSDFINEVVPYELSKLEKVLE